MKKLYTFLLALTTAVVFAQIPQGFTYQAIAFNAAGSPVANGNVSVRISILNNAVSGTNLYTETHSKTTNSKGLINLNIGQGTPVSGTFSGINWAVNSKFIKVEIDPAGGTNYTSVGTNQLMSVPYAMTASKIDVSSTGSSIGEDITESKSSNYFFTDKYDGKVYVLNSKTGLWSPQAYNVTYTNNNTTPEVISKSGNVYFTDRYDGKVYIYSARTGAWTSQAFSDGYINNNNTSPSLTTITNGSSLFIDKYDHKVYVFNYTTGTWSSQDFNIGYTNNNITPTVNASGSNFVFVDKYEHKVNVYNTKTMEWKSQEFNITYYNNNLSAPDVSSSNGNFSFADRYDRKVYVFNSKTGNWTSQQYNVGYYNNNYSTPGILWSETN
ncbi:hypothetical protein C1631_018510 [Chryseobacterium phosphatilyticum]|uniref:Bulb-type lectin domain-containing protein n=1 Tax=Chryseobacterium phosphatilyticum TaxID=475075 RepID=A0A316X619_9FLAO|nr:hypothetical protein [Chryseobacterium phosphatilyticum]PWN68669.1 hypothetical protein C1631_018510 [Chryseobacterium phosphatilyticum]